MIGPLFHLYLLSPLALVVAGDRLRPFKIYDANFQYTATGKQNSDLTSNSVWNANQLSYMVHDGALTGSTTGLLELLEAPANLRGIRVTLSAGGGIGEVSSPSYLPLAELRTGSYNPTSTESLALARAYAMGDLFLVGEHAGYGELYTFDSYDTIKDRITALQITLSRPLRVATPYPLKASATDAINIEAVPAFLEVSGFGYNSDGWSLNNQPRTQPTGPTIENYVLSLTDNSHYESRSVWWNETVGTGSFEASFTYTASGSGGGAAFVLQSDPDRTYALGDPGTHLGYGSAGSTAITPSVAFEISLGGSTGSTVGTAVATNGATGSYQSTGSVSLNSGRPVRIVLAYDAASLTLTETLTDTVTGAQFNRVHTGIDFRQTLGPYATLGFTGSTADNPDQQTIQDFQFSQLIDEMFIDHISSTSGLVNLQTTGDILVNPLAGTMAGASITARNLNLDAGGSVGLASMPLPANITGQVNIAAPEAIYLTQQSGDLHVGYTHSEGSVQLTASGSVVDTNPGVTSFGGNGNGWTLNGTPYASIKNDVLTLTDGFYWEASSAWYCVPVSTESFTVGFTYTGIGTADGAAFVLQNDPRTLKAVGDVAGSLGYGSAGDPMRAVKPSAAYQINLAHVSGAQIPGTNFVLNGATGSYHTTGSVNVASGHPLDVVLVYDSPTRTMTELIHDTVTEATYINTYTGIDLPGTLGATAHVGFTGADGGSKSTQTITNFQFTPGRTLAFLNGFNEELLLARWHNHLTATDVNGDGQVVPFDALYIINYLNSHPSLAALPAEALLVPQFVDVNDDGFLAPMDVLMVINHINSLESSGGEGESTADGPHYSAITASESVLPGSEPAIVDLHGRPAGGANHSAYAFLQFSPHEIAAQSETPTEATNATVPAGPSLRRALPDDAALTADEVFGDLHRWVSSQKARTVHTLSAHVGTEIEELESAIDDLVETVAQGWHGTRN